MKKQGIKVVLLERIQRLGALGDVVTVKPGFARNYLLPQSKALRATAENIATFEKQKEQLKKDNAHKLAKAESIAKTLEHKAVFIVRQASEAGNLYGSVGTRDIAEAVTDNLVEITRHQVLMAQPIKLLGVHQISISLHPELAVPLTVSVAQTEEEAKAQLQKLKDEAEEMKAAKPKKSDVKAEAADAADEAETEVTVEDADATKKKSATKAKSKK